MELRITPCSLRLLAALLPFCLSRPASAQAPEVLFSDVGLVPLDRDRVVRHQSVLIRDGRIAAIGPASNIVASGSAVRVDGRGRYLMPGLADLHVHLFDSRDLVLYLANGVTTIRNLGGYGAADSILELRRQVSAGERPGPTIYTSGNWLDGDPPFRRINTILRTPSDARAEVERQARAGYDFVKVYATLSPEVYDEIVRAAREHRIPVTGHIPGPVGLERVLAGERGQVGIDHAAGLVGAGDAAGLARGLNRSGVSVTTTLVMLRLSIAMRGGPEVVEELLRRPEARFLSPATRQFWREAPFIGMPRIDAAASPYPPAAALVHTLHRHGVPLLLGTDAGLWGNVAGFSALEELRLLVDAGLTPYQALRAATVQAAVFLNRHVPGAEQPGPLAVGNRADLVLLAANPLENLAGLDRPAGVMVRGRWLPAERLDSMLQALERD